MNNKINAFLMYILGTASIMPLATSTHAGEIYMNKDSNGSTVLTNRKSADRSLTKVKVTYYPDSNIHSYRNWGNSEASVLPSYSRNKNAFDHIIQQAAQQHGVSEGLIKAVMHTESGFNVNARSPVGAQGLMQLMPATARRFNVSNAYDPHENIMAGAKYLAWLLKRFNGNTTLALAGYNAGEGNIAKYGGVPPFRETQDYVRRVTSRFSNLYASGVNASSSNSAITANNNSNTQSQNAQVIAQSENYTASNHQVAANKRPQRQIIMAADGRFTDAPAGSYATGNATASARIFISE